MRPNELKKAAQNRDSHTKHVPHLSLDTENASATDAKTAPKGRPSSAQANGLGPRIQPFWVASPERAKYHYGTRVSRSPKAGRCNYHALTGLANGSVVNFLTQANGLG